MKSILETVLSAIFLLALSSVSYATTYTYTGNPFTKADEYFDAGIPLSQDFKDIIAGATNMTLTVTTSGNLSPNTQYDLSHNPSIIKGYVLSDGDISYSGTGVDEQFALITDSTGKISFWSAYYFFITGDVVRSLQTVTNGYDAAGIWHVGKDDGYFRYNLHNPGTWTSDGNSPAPTPEPGSLLLLSLGLAGLAGITRLKKRQ